jgi:hypothetical protein
MILHATTTTNASANHTSEHEGQDQNHQDQEHDDNETSDDSGGMISHVDDENETETD